MYWDYIRIIIYNNILAFLEKKRSQNEIFKTSNIR